MRYEGVNEKAYWCREDKKKGVESYHTSESVVKINQCP